MEPEKEADCESKAQESGCTVRAAPRDTCSRYGGSKGGPVAEALESTAGWATRGSLQLTGDLEGSPRNRAAVGGISKPACEQLGVGDGTADMK